MVLARASGDRWFGSLLTFGRPEKHLVCEHDTTEAIEWSYQAQIEGFGVKEKCNVTL